MNRAEFLRIMGAGAAAAAMSNFTSVSQAMESLQQKKKQNNGLIEELSSTLESQEAVVDKPITAIVIGAGARGRTYASYSEHFSKSLKIVGVADINKERKLHLKNKYPKIRNYHPIHD